MDKKKVDYNRYDTRYQRIVKDLDQYTKNIYPFQLKKRCNESENMKLVLNKKYPPVARCWGERYENCATLHTLADMDMNDDKWDVENDFCSQCGINTYPTVESTISWTNINDFKPKNINDSNFYDQGWIIKDKDPHLTVEKRKPDTCFIIEKDDVNKDDIEEVDKLIEKYENNIVIGNRCYDSVIIFVMIFLILMSILYYFVDKRK